MYSKAIPNHVIMSVQPKRTGLVLGSFAALIHLVWSLLVAAGWAQPLIDFIYKVHFLNNPFEVQAFDPARALLLIVVTFAVGFVAGSVLGLIWNKAQK